MRRILLLRGLLVPGPAQPANAIRSSLGSPGCRATPAISRSVRRTISARFIFATGIGYPTSVFTGSRSSRCSAAPERIAVRRLSARRRNSAKSLRVRPSRSRDRGGLRVVLRKRRQLPRRDELAVRSIYDARFVCRCAATTLRRFTRAPAAGRYGCVPPDDLPDCQLRSNGRCYSVRLECGAKRRFAWARQSRSRTERNSRHRRWARPTVAVREQWDRSDDRSARIARRNRDRWLRLERNARDRSDRRCVRARLVSWRACNRDARTNGLRQQRPRYGRRRGIEWWLRATAPAVAARHDGDDALRRCLSIARGRSLQLEDVIRTSRQTTHTLNAQLGFGIANTHIGGANLVQASLLQGEQHGFGDCLATELELEGIGAILAACRSGHGARVVGAANVLERSVDRIGDPHRFMRC